MAVNKGVMIGCGVAAVLGLCCLGGIGSAVYFGFSVTAAPVKSASEFLTLLGQNQVAEAYNLTSSQFRQNQTQEQFAQAVEQMGLLDYESVSFHNRRRDNDQATLEGTVSTRAGRKISITFTLVNEGHGDEWSVQSVSTPPSGAGPTTSTTLSLPAQEELEKLAAGTMSDFAQAVAAKDFTEFHSRTSRVFQAEAAPARLAEAFGDVLKLEPDLSQIVRTKPVFTEPPAFTPNHLLRLKGYQVQVPQTLEFELFYLYEHPHWKLSGIQAFVTIRPVEGSTGNKPPDAANSSGTADPAPDKPGDAPNPPRPK